MQRKSGKKVEKNIFCDSWGNIKKIKISQWKELAFNYFSYFCSQLKSNITSFSLRGAIRGAGRRDAHCSFNTRKKTPPDLSGGICLVPSLSC